MSWHKRRLVASADPERLRRHGRLPDQRWRELWQARLAQTERRARTLLGETGSVAGRGPGSCPEHGRRLAGGESGPPEASTIHV